MRQRSPSDALVACKVCRLQKRRPHRCAHQGQTASCANARHKSKAAPALHQMQTWWIQVQYSSTDAISRCTVRMTTVKSMLPTCVHGRLWTEQTAQLMRQTQTRANKLLTKSKVACLAKLRALAAKSVPRRQSTYLPVGEGVPRAAVDVGVVGAQDDHGKRDTGLVGCVEQPPADGARAEVPVLGPFLVQACTCAQG